MNEEAQGVFVSLITLMMLYGCRWFWLLMVPTRMLVWSSVVSAMFFAFLVAVHLLKSLVLAAMGEWTQLITWAIVLGISFVLWVGYRTYRHAREELLPLRLFDDMLTAMHEQERNEQHE